MYTLQCWLKTRDCLVVFLLLSFIFILLGSSGAMGGKRPQSMDTCIASEGKKDKLNLKLKRKEIDLFINSVSKRLKVEKSSITDNVDMLDNGRISEFLNYNNLMVMNDFEFVGATHDTHDIHETTFNDTEMDSVMLDDCSEASTEHNELICTLPLKHFDLVMVRYVLSRAAVYLNEDQLSEMYIGLPIKIFIAKSLYFHGVSLGSSGPLAGDDPYEDFIESMFVAAQILKEVNYGNCNSKLLAYVNERISKSFSVDLLKVKYYMSCLKSILDGDYAYFYDNNSLCRHVYDQSKYMLQIKGLNEGTCCGEYLPGNN